MNRAFFLWIPVMALAALVGTLGVGMARERSNTGGEFVPSHMIGKPVPAFNLPAAVTNRPGLNTATMKGEPRLINIFASWCLPCIAEAPQLLALKKAGVRIEGVAVRDKPAAVAKFVNRHGNPFASIGMDKTGQMQLALGATGVPESYIIDSKGRIVYQHIGDIRAEDVPDLVRRVKAAK